MTSLRMVDLRAADGEVVLCRGGYGGVPLWYEIPQFPIHRYKAAQRAANRRAVRRVRLSGGLDSTE